jgi:hypothetical protein
MDGGCCRRTGWTHHHRINCSLVAAYSDICPFCWRCIRDAHRRAVLPEVVAKEGLPAASALNGIEFNFARAVGPGLAGLLIAAAGVGSAFLLNAVSFVGAILFIARWKRPLRKRTAPPETLRGTTVARDSLRPLLAANPHFVGSLRTGYVFRQRTSRYFAVVGSQR